jgi:hypothetical protein
LIIHALFSCGQAVTLKRLRINRELSFPQRLILQRLYHNILSGFSKGHEGEHIRDERLQKIRETLVGARGFEPVTQSASYCELYKKCFRFSLTERLPTESVFLEVTMRQITRIFPFPVGEIVDPGACIRAILNCIWKGNDVTQYQYPSSLLNLISGIIIERLMIVNVLYGKCNYL